MDGDEFVVRRDEKQHGYTAFDIHVGESRLNVASVWNPINGMGPHLEISPGLAHFITRTGSAIAACDVTLGIMAAIDQAADFYWLCLAEYKGVVNEPE